MSGHPSTPAELPCTHCGATPETGPQDGCPECQGALEPYEDFTVLGYCPHGVDLDRAFCPKGCRV